VVLWDEQEKRGWLVNGTSALLHLTRASLEADGNDKFKSAFLFRSDYVAEAKDAFASASAVEVLLNPDNMRLPIYPRKDDLFDERTTRYPQAEAMLGSIQTLDIGSQSVTVFKEKKSLIRFQDRVDHIYHILEQLIIHIAGVDARDGINVKPRVRKHLEGWDFADISENRDPFFPRVATLETMGKGWVDFTRSIHAVPLFGRGFGELIKPSNASQCCQHWKTLPKNKYYLAATVFDLKEIVKWYGNGEADPVELCEDTIVWYSPSRHSTSRKCIEKDSPCQLDYTQIPVSSNFFQRMFRDSRRQNFHLSKLPDSGAVVFGHNKNFNFRVPDVGDPEENYATPASSGQEKELALPVLSSPSESSQPSFHDSGFASAPIQFGSRTLGHSSTNINADVGGQVIESKSGRERP
jgi:hypothetical protein